MNRDMIINAFETYVSNYDLNDPNIYLKYIHTKKVAENCEVIAKSLGLTRCEIDIAWEIGMLHDIGRFEQLRRFHTFQDSISIDHAQYGADLLFVENLIEKFDPEMSEKDLIERAIRCHSLYRIPENLTERQKLFCKIIRDADKVDIYRANYDTGVHIVYGVTENELKQSLITQEVFDVFCEERAIPRNIKRTVADHLVGHVALSFELEYPISKMLTNNQGYLWKLLEIEFENMDTIEKMHKIKEKIRKWYRLES